MSDTLNLSDGSFRIGQQPCQNFRARLDGNIHAEWSNRHECIYCEDGSGLVSFCENCAKDHHGNGYETCGRVQKKETTMTHEELREKAIDFLAKAFEGTTPEAPVHLIQSAVAIALSDDPAIRTKAS